MRRLDHGVGVSLGPKDDPDRAIKKFLRVVDDSGLYDELRKRRSFQKPSVRKRKKHQDHLHSLRLR